MDGSIAVEADDEPAHDLQPGAVYLFYIQQHIPVFIVHFAALRKAALIRRFDADKDRIESGIGHKGDQFWVIGRVDGRFSKENASFFVPAPFDQGREQLLLQRAFVSDKIVVHNKKIIADTGIIYTL
jgi:hypothetical protein